MAADVQAVGEAAAISEPSIGGRADASKSQEKLIVEETGEENAGADALPRSDTQKTFATIVRDKRAQRQQYIFLGLTFFVDVAMPIILYVSLYEISYHTCLQLKGPLLIMVRDLSPVFTSRQCFPASCVVDFQCSARCHVSV